jgi:hypothetical protein
MTRDEKAVAETQETHLRIWYGHGGSGQLEVDGMKQQYKELVMYQKHQWYTPPTTCPFVGCGTLIRYYDLSF